MILFLDDDPNRAAIAYQRMTPQQRDQTIWCQTVEETIVTLKTYREKLHMISLDHDLGGNEYVNSKREDCGMEVIRWLEKFSHDFPENFEKFQEVRFVVHTWNKPAGIIMVERLRKLGIKYAVYKPFGM